MSDRQYTTTSTIMAELIQKALDAGHNATRVQQAANLVANGRVFDAGCAGEWIVFSSSVDVSNPAELFNWKPGVGNKPSAKRYITAPQPAENQRVRTCPDASTIPPCSLARSRERTAVFSRALC